VTSSNRAALSKATVAPEVTRSEVMEFSPCLPSTVTVALLACQNSAIWGLPQKKAGRRIELERAMRRPIGSGDAQTYCLGL
jgi:hypothetical protein